MNVEMELSRVLILDSSAEQFITLEEKGGSRSFAIKIGTAEALAIERRLRGELPMRPQTHELVDNMKTAGLDVEPHFITNEQVDGKVFTTTGHALGNRTLIVQQVSDKYLLPNSPTALHRLGPTDFDRCDQTVRYPTKNGAWVISYEAGYPLGRFEANR